MRSRELGGVGLLEAMVTKSQNWEAVPGFSPDTGKYVPLNLDHWLRDHKILEDGKSRGAKDLPASDIESLGGTEQRIVDWVNQRGRNCRDIVATYLSDVERLLANMDRDEDLDDTARQVGEKAQNGKRELEKQADSRINAMAPREEAMRHASRDFEHFRQENRLTRPPDYSHRRNSAWWISGALLFEVALNASLLMEVSPFGFMGSFGQMGLISLLNVVLLGLAMGTLLRQVNHVHLGRKLLAVLGGLVLLSAAIAFNLLVGHFRDSMQAVANAPATELFVIGDDALQRFLAQPFSWDAFQSLLLALLGLAFFLFGGFEWLRRDDPYPGYGQRDRQLLKEQQSYAAAYDQSQSALGQTFKEYEGWLKDERHKLRIQQDRYRELVVRCQGIRENYPTNLQQYQYDLDYLLEAWRTANRDARSTPPPSHFAAKVQIDPGVLLAPDFSPPADNSMDHRETLRNQVHEAISQLQEDYNRLRRRFKRIDELSDGKREL
ncbi:MAG: hypothetical protein F4X81_00610 [Gammaproteobacteria bacterium]|nr:hypothetical protein [Gammaproteobacteria bacterium]MYE49948.1 hypothetical protein [Gammaproteobacteria bacterium]MYF48959.1 hypothetical protein [Gammaproteobacteria bacterium]MYH14853.1 hypothetical protein [Gammaproteobacteria bacterium]